MRTDLALDALEQAIYDRCDDDTGDLVHHSDRGTQYLSIRYTERLADAGIELSVGSRGDAYDNALAETVIGLFKTEVIRRHGPWRSLEAVEFATLEWVDWFNNRRLLEPIGYLPPAEYEARYYQQAAVPESPNSPSEIPGTIHSFCRPGTEEQRVKRRWRHSLRHCHKTNRCVVTAHADSHARVAMTSVSIPVRKVG
jgi:hypothetical protein